MNKINMSQAEGQLVSAVSSGGLEALWRMANRSGPVGDLARAALEKLTEPGIGYSPLEAVNYIVQNHAS
jgi:hypothetical protein